jgi:hypothetical protein
MTSDDAVIAALSDANPVARTVAPDSLERAEADRVLHRVMSSPARPRHRSAVLVPVLSTLLVLAVVAVLVRSGGAGHNAAPRANAVNLTFQALPTPQTPVITPAAMAREVSILRKRLVSVQGGYRVALAGGERIAVTSANATGSTQARVVELVTGRAELLFFDWEANALTPNGNTVADQLQTQDRPAVTISQGSSTAAPGDPGAGGVSLYQAVQLAAKQPQAPISQHLSRIGPQYYMFGAPGSAGCAAVASAQHTIPIQGDHCLLAGPDDGAPATTRRQAINSLVAQLPLGVNRADGQVLVVPQGTVAPSGQPDRARAVVQQTQRAVLRPPRSGRAVRGGDHQPTLGHRSNRRARRPVRFYADGAERISARHRPDRRPRREPQHGWSDVRSALRGGAR